MESQFLFSVATYAFGVVYKNPIQIQDNEAFLLCFFFFAPYGFIVLAFIVKVFGPF